MKKYDFDALISEIHWYMNRDDVKWQLAEKIYNQEKEHFTNLTEKHNPQIVKSFIFNILEKCSY